MIDTAYFSEEEKKLTTQIIAIQLFSFNITDH